MQDFIKIAMLLLAAVSINGLRGEGLDCTVCGRWVVFEESGGIVFNLEKNKESIII